MLSTIFSVKQPRSIKLVSIGVALFKQGNIEASLDFFQKGLEKNPDDAQLRYNFEKVLEIQKKNEEAVKMQGL